MVGEMSPVHWAIVIGVAILLFGARRLPEAARALGRSARILKAEIGALGDGERPETANGVPDADIRPAPPPALDDGAAGQARAAEGWTPTAGGAPTSR